jgi:hypothetical protein
MKENRVSAIAVSSLIVLAAGCVSQRPAIQERPAPIPQATVTKPVETRKPLAVGLQPGIFDYNGRKMTEWNPLMEVVKSEGCTIEERKAETPLTAYDILFWTFARSTNDTQSLIFTFVDMLVRQGKMVVLVPTSFDPSSVGEANQILRHYGMTLTKDDVFSGVAHTVGNHPVSKPAMNFVASRFPFVEINNERCTPLAQFEESLVAGDFSAWRGKPVLAIYEDPDTHGCVVGSGFGAGMLFGMNDAKNHANDQTILEIVRRLLEFQKRKTRK